MECNLLLDGQLKGRKYFGNTTVHGCVCGGGEGERGTLVVWLSMELEARGKKSMLLVAGKPMGPDLLVQGKLETFVR